MDFYSKKKTFLIVERKRERNRIAASKCRWTNKNSSYFFHYLVKVGIKFKRCAGTFQIACFPWLTFDYVRAKHNSKYFHNRNIVSLFRMRKLERIAQLDEEVRRLKAEKEELGEVKKIYLKNVSLEWSANFLLKKLAKKVFRLWEFLKFILLWSLILSGYPSRTTRL